MLSQKDYLRYTRHLSLDEVGEKGRSKLKAAKSFIGAGLGGFGMLMAQSSYRSWGRYLGFGGI